MVCIDSSHRGGGLDSYRVRQNEQEKRLETTDEDSEYDLCFVVEEVEFLTYKQGFI